MISTEASVSHDHDYCAAKVEEEKDIDFVVETLLEASSPKDIINTEKESFNCGSPTYSCDSGIDSFANDLVQGFGGEGEDLLNFLLEDDFDLETKPQESLDFNQNWNSSVKMAEMFPTKKAIKGEIVKKSFDEPSTSERNRKNAENAKENRRKKKLYIEGIEKEVGQLRNEKNVLTGKLHRLDKKANELQDEVNYLKSVLANQSMLSKLIKNVSVLPGVSLSTSFHSSRESSLLKENDVECEKENTVSTRSSSRKRSADSNSQSTPSAKKGRSETDSTGGVCLHVKQNKVSLEFCPHCSKMSED